MDNIRKLPLVSKYVIGMIAVAGVSVSGIVTMVKVLLLGLGAIIAVNLYNSKKTKIIKTEPSAWVSTSSGEHSVTLRGHTYTHTDGDNEDEKGNVMSITPDVGLEANNEIGKWATI